MDEDSLKVLLAQGLSVEGIARRFGRHPSTVSYWMAKYGLTAPNREKHAAKGGIDRDVLVGLVAAGLSIAEIANEVGLSKATVRHWLRRYELRTRAARRAQAGAAAGEQDTRAVREEAAKCVILCSNCHAELESGVVTLPVK